MSELNVANRTLAIMDNLPFLRSLNNECIDLIAIDPPFVANETFINRPKPAISQAEFDEEVALARRHGVQHNEVSARPGSRTFGIRMRMFILTGKPGLKMITPGLLSYSGC